MARITETHTHEFADARGDITPRFKEIQKFHAQASQIGRGVRVEISKSLLITTREEWEKINLVVDQAFRDDEEIPIKDPVWSVK